MTKKESVLRFSIPGRWGKLVPAQQNTALGSMILSAEFESLVKHNANGLIVPSLAKSWTVNENFTLITFQIDTSKKFSDGSYLTAQDIKNSWESGLKLEAKSYNHSMADILYLIDGYGEFTQTNHFPGIKVVSQSEISIKFIRPFRLALDNFFGVRFAVSKIINSKHIGTGPYRITSEEKNLITLEKNKYHNDKNMLHDKIKISYNNYPENIELLKKGEIDVTLGNMFFNIPECEEANSTLACIEGQESSHLIISLNGLNESILNDKKLRQALQYLIKSKLKKASWETLFAQGFELDHQIFLPMQKGRLSQFEVETIIDEGKKHISLLIQKAANKGIRFHSRDASFLTKILSDDQININEIKESSSADWLQLYYKTFETDMIFMGISIAHGDPDGIYHALGKTGAISSKMTYRTNVGDLLEQGRSLSDIEKLDEHYKKVNRTILEEVPFVHLGFNRHLYIFNKTNIKINDAILHRRGIDFNVFEKL